MSQARLHIVERRKVILHPGVQELSFAKGKGKVGKELGISGNGHSKNIAEIKEFARRGARTIFDIEDMRRGLKMGSTLIPSDQFKALGVSAQLGVDVTPYLADVSPRIVVDKTQFCRTAER